jgi:hypothetical protein
MIDIIAGDALLHMQQVPAGHYASCICMPPDSAEIDLSPDAYVPWLAKVADLMARSVSGPIAICITDRKHNGVWQDKAALLTGFFARLGKPLNWHKIALRRDVGAIDLHRPTYSHLLAFGGRPGPATPDVFYRGEMLWPNAMGVEASRVAVGWVKNQGLGHIFNPFAGMGQVLLTAREFGLDATGVEMSASRLEVLNGVFG